MPYSRLPGQSRDKTNHIRLLMRVRYGSLVGQLIFKTIDILKLDLSIPLVDKKRAQEIMRELLWTAHARRIASRPPAKPHRTKKPPERTRTA